MRCSPFVATLIAWFCISTGCVHAEPKKGKLPHVEFDVEGRQVRVECEALSVDAPLEFFCCVTGTNEHESVLRTPARPSDIQIALLAIGLKPGRPITYSESLNKWLPPEGPPLHLSIEYEKDGKTVNYPANRCLRELKTKKSPAAFTWVYTGSRVMGDGKFAADVTGYVVTVVNFDLSLIDVPELKSSANETLELERNPDVVPKTGTKVWMIIEPVGGPAKPAEKAPDAPKSQGPGLPDQSRFASLLLPATLLEAGGAAAPDAKAPDTAPIDPVKIDQAKVDDLKRRWEEELAPRRKAMQAAAQAHFHAVEELRKEQHRLIDEADRIQRTIDELEKQYQDLTTPQPALPAQPAK